MPSDHRAPGTATPDAYTVVLPRLPNALTAGDEGRRFAKTHLSRWNVTDQVIDEVCLLATELIANAVRHAPPPLSLHVSLNNDRVRVEVHDSAPVPPTLTIPDADSLSGRGVWLVDTIASRWGHHVLPSAKVVWFEIDANRQPQRRQHH